MAENEGITSFNNLIYNNVQCGGYVISNAYEMIRTTFQEIIFYIFIL
jgi:hypothetical protein